MEICNTWRLYIGGYIMGEIQKIHEYLEEIFDLKYGKLNRLLKDYQSNIRWNVDVSKLSVEEMTEYQLLDKMMDKLNDLLKMSDYYNKEIVYEGSLVKQANGRYSVNGSELTSGAVIEYLVESDNEPSYFEKSRIEHANGDYFIVSRGKDKPIEGIHVRVRI